MWYRITTDTERIKFEHQLEKKIKLIEYLGKVLIDHERDYMRQYNQQ